MNVNLLANNPSWWWYLVLSGAALGLVLVIWIIVKNIKVRSPLSLPVLFISSGTNNRTEMAEKGEKAKDRYRNG